MSLLMFDIFANCSIRVNFACFMNLWPFILKWFHAGMALRLLKSFLLLFTLQLNGVFGFPTYWILHNMHSIEKITYWLLQVSLRNKLNVLFVCWLINVYIYRESTWSKFQLDNTENQRFCDVFRGYQKRLVAWNGLIRKSLKVCLSVEFGLKVLIYVSKNFYILLI